MASQQWTREQVLIAFNLYCQLSFGQLHRHNPLIIKSAHLINRTPDALAMKLVNLASLDPAITGSGRKGLAGCSKLDREIWQEFMTNTETIGEESQLLIDSLVVQDNTLRPLASGQSTTTTPTFYAEDICSTVKIRIKQAFFRKAILSSYNSTCCMSGITHPSLLIASHIIPWSQNHHQRLNPANGLCLSALHDKAYDIGLISVSPNLIIHVSEQLKDTENSLIAQQHLLALEGKAITLPQKFHPHPDFLTYHMEHIFLKY